MKKRPLVVAALFASMQVLAQDTLQHFDPTVDTPVADAFPSSNGYHTGHNNYSDEEFAEKYEITGDASVLGVVAIHTGTAGTSGMNSQYKIYNVNGSGLPGTEVASKSVLNNDIPVDGSMFTTLFNNPASVSDEFFVSFNLGDYAHNDPGTKRIALTHSEDGTRPSSDLSVFGRNAIRWHSHDSGADWKDYRTENFQGYEPSVHFSLFPIVELAPASIIGLNGNEGSIGAVYPNPSTNFDGFTVPVKTNAGGDVIFQLFDLSGKIVAERHETLYPGETNYLFSGDELKTGTYLLFVTLPEGGASQKVTVH
jgi:hypothetical protein